MAQRWFLAHVTYILAAGTWISSPLYAQEQMRVLPASPSGTFWQALPLPPAKRDFPEEGDLPESSAPLNPTSPTRIDASPRTLLPGNLRPEANQGNDLGMVEDTLPLDHILLQLRPATAERSSLDAYLAGLTDKSSPNYHHWLTPEQFGNRFGVSQQNLDRVLSWLMHHNLVVNTIYPNRLLIDFSGTAAQIQAAFQTEIHAYEVEKVHHIANASNPTIPSALESIVVGIVSLHDFRPHSLFLARSPHPGLTEGAGASIAYPVTPTDLATIYDLTPLFKAGYTGKGQILAVIGDSDVHSTTDWTTFRSAFGLSAYTTGSFKQVHPAPSSGTNNCSDPGAIRGWDEESILDAEYASAAAPGAAIELASCASTNVTNGNLIALENLVNSAGTLPSVLSISYGNCEAANGAAANAAISAAYQQAAAEGISVFAAAGDGGASFCDLGATVATHGIGVNAYASTPYNVAVGGTDFSDTYAGTNSTYWSKSNTSTDSSAKSYIPETPWDDSCANPLIAAWNGYKVTYGALGFCNEDYLTLDAYQTTVATSGGPSGCATGAPTASFEVSGTCHGTGKPLWQSVTGNSRDGVRDLPDVSLFAADGIWSHYYLFCNSNLNDADGAVCKTTNVADWSQGGGTSFAAPILAGIQAVIAQKWGRQGNPNPVYYKLAATQFASTTLKTACNSSNGPSSNTACIFHDVTQGASAVNCQGTINCYTDILSTSLVSYAPAYNATAGWDFATGLGSIDAYNLAMSPAW